MLGKNQAWGTARLGQDSDGEGGAAALSSLGHRRGCGVDGAGDGQAQEALVGPSVEDCTLTCSLHMPTPHLSPRLLSPIHTQWLGLGWFAVYAPGRVLKAQPLGMLLTLPSPDRHPQSKACSPSRSPCTEPGGASFYSAGAVDVCWAHCCDWASGHLQPRRWPVPVACWALHRADLPSHRAGAPGLGRAQHTCCVPAPPSPSSHLFPL